MIKPSPEEKIIITILLSISFGLFIGVLSAQEKINELETDKDLLILHLQEVTEMNDTLLIMRNQTNGN
tara:strand:- start:49 stop:252 length:204 start_codon:yes stop_codon:yes gene_type:complete